MVNKMRLPFAFISFTASLAIIVGILYIFTLIIDKKPLSQIIAYSLFWSLMILLILLKWKEDFMSHRKSVSIFIDNRGIYYWDNRKRQEIGRINFDRVVRVHWNDNQRYSYVSVILKSNDGKIKFTPLPKKLIQTPDDFKKFLEEKVELQNSVLSRKEFKSLRDTLSQ